MEKACPRILDTKHVTAQTINTDHARQATTNASDYQKSVAMVLIYLS